MNIKEKKQRLKEILSGSETLQKSLAMNNFEEVYYQLPQYLIPVFTDVSRVLPVFYTDSK